MVPKLSETTAWILTELETSISSLPPPGLQLISPVIQRIRLPLTERRISRSSPPTLPLSRYSTFMGPLSSHPPNPPYTPGHQIIPTQSRDLPSMPTHPTLALRTIFPHAPTHLLSSLQATYIALHYVSTIYLPSSTPFPFMPPSTHLPTPSDLSDIPCKARAMLGIQTPTSRPSLPTSWIWPETLGWKERTENLEVRLRREVKRLIRECEKRETGREDALVKAVWEIVGVGEWVRA